MKHLFNNQLGFSLVQGMVVASVIAGTSLVTTRLLTDQKLAQKGAETRDQIEDLNNTIFSVLQNRNHCKETMVANNNIALALKDDTTTKFELNTINTVDDIVVQVGSFYMNHNVQVDKIELMPQTQPGLRNLEITYERLNKSERTKTGYGAKKIKKIFTLRIQKNPTGIGQDGFTSCYSVTKKKDALNGQESQETGNDISKELCNELNDGLDSNGNSVPGKKLFKWDENISMCVPDANCPPDKIYTGFDSTGTVKCRDIRDWMNLEDIIDSTPPDSCPPGSKVRFDIVGSKVKINCTPPPEYCSTFDVAPDETGGCVEGPVLNYGSWNSVSPECECREETYEYRFMCNNPDGFRTGTKCRFK